MAILDDNNHTNRHHKGDKQNGGEQYPQFGIIGRGNNGITYLVFHLACNDKDLVQIFGAKCARRKCQIGK